MKKTPTMFVRDEKNPKFITSTPHPEAAWVFDGEGIATRKWDGTCCMFKGGNLFKRYDGTKGKYLPPDFIAAEDAESHWLGWRPVGNGPEDRWHAEAFNSLSAPLPDGTYELIGPRVNGNPDGAETHCFRKHGDVVYEKVPRDFDGLKDWLTGKDIEGLVFHHPDGRMAKIKLKDLGIKRPQKAEAGQR